MVEDPWKSGVTGDARFYLDLLTHDIKNLNQGVHGYLELMTMMPDTTKRQKRFLEEAISYVRMSSNLINSIELDSHTNGREPSIGLSKAINDARDYIVSLNSNMELEIIIDGLNSERTVRGNLLLVDVFLFLLDFMLKRCEEGKLRIDIRIRETLDNSVQIRLEGDFQPPERSAMVQLFSDSDTISGRKKGKLILCRSVIERFGGTINYFDPSTISGFRGGGFIVELREAEQ